MPGNILVNGIVISSMPIGEYDKRIVLLTKEIGKVAAFVRGARKPNSPFVGISNAFIYGEFELYRGRSSYTVNKANAIFLKLLITMVREMLMRRLDYFFCTELFRL